MDAEYTSEWAGAVQGKERAHAERLVQTFLLKLFKVIGRYARTPQKDHSILI
jgi:hypothetical protein